MGATESTAKRCIHPGKSRVEQQGNAPLAVIKFFIDKHRVLYYTENKVVITGGKWSLRAKKGIFRFTVGGPLCSRGAIHKWGLKLCDYEGYPVPCPPGVVCEMDVPVYLSGKIPRGEYEFTLKSFTEDGSPLADCKASIYIENIEDVPEDCKPLTYDATGGKRDLAAEKYIFKKGDPVEIPAGSGGESAPVSEANSPRSGGQDGAEESDVRAPTPDCIS